MIDLTGALSTFNPIAELKVLTPQLIAVPEAPLSVSRLFAEYVFCNPIVSIKAKGDGGLCRYSASAIWARPIPSPMTRIMFVGFSATFGGASGCVQRSQQAIK